ncbi:MAG: hypothetical protein JSV99_00655 [Planctomycetota bacterium]|nr:MAG: hypothetical protein JSV99_00655 [Planctomycetota bacterium]
MVVLSDKKKQNQSCPPSQRSEYPGSVWLSLTADPPPLTGDLFMQIKPNFPDAPMNVTSFCPVDYENESNRKLGENKANTKPIKANTNPIPEKPKSN